LANKIYDFQLKVSNTGRALRAPGGQALVVAAGGTQKLALQDVNGNVATNPISLNNGRITFRTATTVAAVDVYVMSPTGNFLVIDNITAGDRGEFGFDADVNTDTLNIPFNIADYPAGVETSTGFVLPKDVGITGNAGVLVTVAETAGAKTLGFGTLSTEAGGSATGFGVAVDVSTLGMVWLKSAATATRGAYLGAGTLDRPFRTDGVAKTISITPVTASVSVAGYLIIPVILPPSLLPAA
jgi:hypothetical protein